jgi:hypothetical protein
MRRIWTSRGAELSRGKPDFHERDHNYNAPTGTRYGEHRGSLSVGSWAATAKTTFNQACWTQQKNMFFGVDGLEIVTAVDDA